MKRTIRLITALLLFSLVFPAAVFGAASSVSLSAGNSAKEGDTVTVTVTYKGNSLGYVNGQLTYDNSKLQYVSGGSSTGDAGLVELKAYAEDASGKLSFKVKFKAVGAGSVNLNLETLETQNLDGDQSMGTPSASRTVKITGARETETTTEATSSEEVTSEETTMPDSAGQADGSQEQQENGSGISYPLLGVIAAALILLIVLIAVKLRKRK